MVKRTKRTTLSMCGPWRLCGSHIHFENHCGETTKDIRQYTRVLWTEKSYEEDEKNLWSRRDADGSEEILMRVEHVPGEGED